MPTVKIPARAALTRTLSQLIEETNKHVLSTPLPAPEPQKEQPTARTSPRSHEVTFSPEWVEEFNRETLEKEAQEREAAKAAAEAARQAAIALMKEEARLQQEAEQKKREEEQAALQPRNILDWVSRKSS